MKEVKKKVPKYYIDRMKECHCVELAIRRQLAVNTMIQDSIWEDLKKEGFLPEKAITPRLNNETGELIYKLFESEKKKKR